MIIDAIFIILMVLACYKGLRKGLIIALFSVLGFIIGIVAALKLSAVVAAQIAEHGGTGKWWPALSFLMVFLAAAIAVNLCGRLIQKTFETVMLGWANRIAGVLLYAFLYCIIFSVFLFYGAQLHIIKADTISASMVYPYLQPAAPKIIDGIGKLVPVFKNMFSSLEQFFESFSKAS